ncbi:trans-ocimene synthase, chloroplastic-like [Nymphaea colorata]|nr:trans-ocimene synthase, chloroplastic-like [Nymphaea colorata]
MASEAVTRRSANYHPTVWDHTSIQSISSAFSEEQHGDRREQLKSEVKSLLEPTETQDPSGLLKNIDSIRRLGVGYHFEKEIKAALQHLCDVHGNQTQKDLHETALRFRLLRQYGFNVSSDIFNSFKDKEGNFKLSLAADVKGLLSLYEASYLGFDGEDNLDEAKSFSALHLKAAVGGKDISIDEGLKREVERALDLPLHWRAERLEVRSSIDAYEEEEEKNLALLELAKLDFNILQTIYHKELKELARWWRELELDEKLSFARDRLAESYLWGVTTCPEPQHSDSRKVLGKLVALLSVLDDVYDLYASIDEVELLTKASERWDLKVLGELPHFMKLCYLAVFNFINEIAYLALKKHGLDATEILKDEWIVMCKSKLVEAKWYHEGHKPTLEEHMNNAWASLGLVPALLMTYLALDIQLTKEIINMMRQKSRIIYWASVIHRLTNDVGTGPSELERGDVQPALHCHMNEKGVEEEAAREHINSLLNQAWKKLNKECAVATDVPRALIDASVNLARATHFFYKDGDGFGVSDGKTKEHIASLLVHPIPI